MKKKARGSHRPARHSPARAQQTRAFAPAGTAVWAGLPRDGRAVLALRVWDEQTYSERSDLPPAEIKPQRGPPADWLDCAGLHDADVVAQVGRAYGLHPLAIEDILNPATAIRAESYADHLFLTARRPRVVDGHVELDPVAFALGDGWLLSFRHADCDAWGPVVQRLAAGTTFLRVRDVDHVLHALLDGVIDAFFESLRALESLADGMEEEALERPDHDLPRRVYALRSEFQALRRALLPLKELAAVLRRGDDPRIQPAMRPYFADVYDHVGQALESVEHGRDRLVALLELHLSLASNRMNEVMKTLTVVGAVFIPLSFLAGVWGMNFDHMPELHWRAGYGVFWTICAAVTGVTLAWMRRKELL